MRKWYDRHFEKIIVTMLGLGVSAWAVNAFTRRRLDDPSPLLGTLEWALLAWCVVAPVGTVFWMLRNRSLQDDRAIRQLVVYLIVCGYLGIKMALTVHR
jgi:hypothetical protein